MRWLPIPVLLALSAYGQSADTRLEFEAASVKPSQGQPATGVWSASGGPGTPDPGQWTATWVSLYDLILRAYEMSSYQVAGPEWLKTQHFDVAAKLPIHATREQFPKMLRSLLESRFQLSVHEDRKEMPIYELVVARGGSKLKPWSGEPAVAYLPPSNSRERKVDPDGYPILPEGPLSGRSVVRGYVTQRIAGAGIDRIVNLLKPSLDRLILDRTGLTGKYDILLRYVVGRPEGPTLIEAIQAQLGLKLEAAKGMVEVLTVDHADKLPVDN